MKHSKKVEKLAKRQKAYEETLAARARAGENSDGFHRPGSVNK